MHIKDELLRQVADHKEIYPFCGEVIYGKVEVPEAQVDVRFHTPAEWFRVDLSPLDFEHENSYGDQTVFGTVVFSDGSWMSLAEYDGSAYWTHYKTPTVEHVMRGY